MSRRFSHIINPAGKSDEPNLKQLYIYRIVTAHQINCILMPILYSIHFWTL